MRGGEGRGGGGRGEGRRREGRGEGRGMLNLTSKTSHDYTCIIIEMNNLGNLINY